MTMIKTTTCMDDVDESRPFENTAEGSKLQGFEDLGSLNDNSTNNEGNGGGFMIGKNKL